MDRTRLTGAKRSKDKLAGAIVSDDALWRGMLVKMPPGVVTVTDPSPKLHVGMSFPFRFRLVVEDVEVTVPNL
jgi:hypothetical protein